MRKKWVDNSLGAKKWRLRRWRTTPTDCARAEHCHRQSERWFMRVYDLSMNNGWALRHPTNEHLMY